MSAHLTSLGIFQHHNQKSFQLDQKYFETFIILGMGTRAQRYTHHCCCCGNFGAWNFANHVQYVFGLVSMQRTMCETKASVQKHKSYEKDWHGRGSTREEQRQRLLCVYRCHFLATEVISMAKLHSQIILDVEVLRSAWMDRWMLKMPFECRSKIACNLCPSRASNVSV